MKRFYIIIDQDNKGELVYKPTEYTATLEAFAATGVFLMWGFTHHNNQIIVYAGALSAMPVGEEREEMEQRILSALGLI
ncbi:MAG: hypothetical protein ABI970_24515 [Chloroflexota bacterium]